MTFIDRSLLVALVALAIPLAIHLLGRRRARLLHLPTMRFAAGAHQASRAALWLRRVTLLALRMAIVALVVLALAGPHLAPACLAPGHLAPGEYTGGQAREGPPLAPQPPMYSRGAKYQATIANPIRVLIVDAAAPAPLNSADLVAATFRGDTSIPKTVARATAADVGVAAIAGADVIFWVGPLPPPTASDAELFSHQSVGGAGGNGPLARRLARGGGLVWMPAAPGSGDLPREVFGVRFGGIEETPAGATIDPAGYTSNLLEAFEAGTGGDLAAPVLRRRLTVTNAADLKTIRFHDGAVAIADRRIGPGRAVVLTFGPATDWGDLAGRAEFVVLMHSLAESLAPQLALACLAPGHLAPGEYTGGQAREGSPLAPQPPVYSRGANGEGFDLAPWLIFALAAALAVEGFVAGRAGPPA